MSNINTAIDFHNTLLEKGNPNLEKFAKQMQNKCALETSMGKRDELLFKFTGATPVAGVKKDNSYRSFTAMAGQEGYLSGAYVGKKKILILRFTPKNSDLSLKFGDDITSFEVMYDKFLNAFGPSGIQRMFEKFRDTYASVDSLNQVTIQATKAVEQQLEQQREAHPLWGSF